MARGSGSSLARYFLTRLALVAPMLVILLTTTFLLLRVAPGDPITATLGWFPTGGRTAPFFEPRSITGLYTVDALLTRNWGALASTLRYLALPAITLGMAIGGIFVRLVRVNMIQTLKADYVEAARARGIPERQVVLRHAFRNAAVPVVTIVGLQFALLLSGAVLTETTFTWPGIGLSLYQFLQDRDYIGVQGLVTFYALFVVVVSLLIDVVSAWVDPRIRYS